jgi:hypothetical protein
MGETATMARRFDDIEAYLEACTPARRSAIEPTAA